MIKLYNYAHRGWLLRVYNTSQIYIMKKKNASYFEKKKKKKGKETNKRNRASFRSQFSTVYFILSRVVKTPGGSVGGGRSMKKEILI